MPVELTEREIRDALAVLEEWDREGARDAESALAWMGWEGEGPLLLRRYEVQLFVWYQLPRKWLASLERKRAAAGALAHLLERLGSRAAGYAEVCRSPETERLLRAWDQEDPDAGRRFRKLLDGSGIEPPDTELLAWGSLMGLEEARVREQVALALEQAIEEGRLAPGGPGFRRRQAQVANAALCERWDGDEALTRLEAVQAERLERWFERGQTRGSRERRAILELAAATVADPPRIEPEPARAALVPALWLLEQAGHGIGLTQTGALNRALVREAVERWPSWWDTTLFGPPHREDEVALLRELHGLLRRTRLVRRSGRRIVATGSGRRLGGDAQAILPAIVAEGWRAAGRPPSERNLAWAVGDLLCAAESLGLLARQAGAARYARDRLVLTPAGRTGLAAGLRARALAPARAI